MTPNPLLGRTERSRTVTAVLGPTNTGKTHLAIDRMIAHRSGLIGLPLRLLAREVYTRIAEQVGEDRVALVTGEEKIVPPNARYHVATVEAMPLDLAPEFVAIDEVQLAADLERGRVFTDRILRVRGQYETLLLGALTARGLLERLLPGLNVVTRPRMSVLSYAGEKKITRLPPRSAVVAFSANEVYAIAELIRRQRGGAAIVMGALSPRTRNAQVELFQSGDVEFLIATDAIGMGLNLDVDHVAFASARKFDGYQFRQLSAAELAQIAGRAGRHTRDGTFGVTARVAPFEDELVEALETHAFQPVKVFQWRNPELDFSSIAALKRSLEDLPREEGLTRAPPADDQKALEHATKTPAIMDMVSDPARVELLWDVCQVPDYRKIAPANHADLILTLFQFLVQDGVIPDDWIQRQVRYADKTDGDIDTLSNRIAHIRTWTFVANRSGWLEDPQEWREKTRKVEDRLSDALHERLMARFVDRRTSVLMKRLRENAMLESEVNDAGDVIVEGQHVGALHGFRFLADASSGDPRDQKALKAAASKALVKEIEKRADRLSAAPDTAFALGSDGAVRWQGAVVAKLTATDDTLKPAAVLLADEMLAAGARERVQGRVTQWVGAHVEGLLKPLFDLRVAEGLEAGARGLAYRIAEGLGSVERTAVADEAKALDQTARAGLRGLGVRFGAYHIFVPALLKPAPSQLLAILWALRHADLDVPGLVEVPQLSASGRTSITVDTEVPRELYRVVGFRVCGPRAVRIDILERLADQIRPLVAWRPGPDAGEPPPGAVPQGGGFLVTVTMTSLLGCSGEDFAAVLTSLGYRVERREASAAERAAIRSASEVRGKPSRRDARPGARPIAAAAPASAPAEAAATGAPPVDGSEPAEADAIEAEAAEPAAEEAGLETAFREPAAAPETASEPVVMAATDPEGGPTHGHGPGEAAVAGGAAAEVEAPAADGEPTDTLPEWSEGSLVPEPVEAAAVAEAPAADAAPPDVEVLPADAALPDDEPATGEVAQTAGADGDEAAAGELAADEPDGAAEAAVAEPADEGPAIIEIWRVPRHQRSGDPRRRRGGAGRREGEPGRRDGESGDRRRPRHGEAERPSQHRGHGEGHGQARAPGEGHAPHRRAEAKADAPAHLHPSAASAPPEAPGEEPRPGAFHSGPTAAERHGHDQRREGKRGKKRQKPQRIEPQKPPRREKEADPDSPFAALAALKERLEKGGGDR